MVRVSLSELHTSRTALRKCVCNVLVCLQTYIVNFKSVFKYFPKSERPCALKGRWRAMLGYCQSPALATLVEMAQKFLLSMRGTLLLVCHSSYRPTINGRLLTDHTNYTHRVEIASGKGRVVYWQGVHASWIHIHKRRQVQTEHRIACVQYIHEMIT